MGKEELEGEEGDVKVSFGTPWLDFLRRFTTSLVRRLVMSQSAPGESHMDARSESS